MADTGTTRDRFGRCLISECPTLAFAILKVRVEGRDIADKAKQFVHDVGHGLDFIDRGQESRLLDPEFKLKHVFTDKENPLRLPKSAMFLELRVAGYQRLIEEFIPEARFEKNLLSPDNLTTAIHSLAGSDDYLGMGLAECKAWTHQFANEMRPHFPKLLRDLQTYCHNSVFVQL